MKKTSKKLVSLLLAVVMLLSTVTVGFVAFAADEELPPIKVADFKKTVTAAYANFTNEEYEFTVDDVDALKADFARMTVKDKGTFLSSSSHKAAKVQYGEMVSSIVEYSEYDYAEEIADFVMTPAFRPMDSEVAWTTEGIQSAVDGLWSLITDDLGPILGAANIYPSKGLIEGVYPAIASALNNSFAEQGNDFRLPNNIYSADTINLIFEVYAMLSHIEEPVEGIPVGGGTIGGLIDLLFNATIKTTWETTSAVTGQDFSAADAKFKEAANAKLPEGSTKCDAYTTVKLTNEDLGIVDKETFKEALIAALRTIGFNISGDNMLLGLAQLNLSAFDSVDMNGEFSDGLYSILANLLEELGATNLPTAAEYEANFVEVKKNDQKQAYDTLFRPLIDALFDQVLAPIDADPINAVIDLLPRLAGLLTYTSDVVDEETGEIVEAGVPSKLQQELGKVFTLIGGPESIGTLADSLVINGDVINGLIGMDFDWDALANSATVEAVKSFHRDNAYRLVRTGDTDVVFGELFKLVYSLVANQETIDMLKGTLEGIIGPKYDVTLSGLTDGKLTIARIEKWVSLGEEGAYADFLGAFGEPKGEAIPKPIVPPTDVPGGNGGNGGKPVAPVNPNEKTPTKNPNIPNTGVEMEVITSGVAYVVAMALVGLAVSMLLNKKKIEE